SSHQIAKDFNVIYEKGFGFTFEENSIPNYILYLLPLKSYIQIHLPFQKDFEKKHGVSFQTIVAIIYLLCFLYLQSSLNEKPGIILNIIQRGYEGPSKISQILKEIIYYKKFAE